LKIYKHSYEFAKGIIEKEGYQLLSKEYHNAHEKLRMLCDKDHEFEMKFYCFYNNNQRCSVCFGTPKKTYDFVKEQIEKTGYKLLSTDYKGNKVKLKIQCDQGHEYEPHYNSFQQGRRCNKCKYIKQGILQKHSIDHVRTQIEKEEGYKLLSEEYLGAFKKLKIQCCKGHEYEVIIYNDFRNGMRCPKCCHSQSKAEIEILEYIKSLGFEVEERNRTIIPPFELDIVIPEKKIAIEHCGLYWHSEDRIDKNYHLDKLNYCNRSGYRLITIFEDEWFYKNEIVKNRLKHIFGLEKEKVYARRCEVKEIDVLIAKNFINQYHVQGYRSSTICLGAYENDILVAVITFTKRKEKVFELSRFCTSKSVVGIAGKLLKHFKHNYEWESIVTFADRRWSDGNLYEKIGMKVDGTLEPDYSYFKNNRLRFHKFDFRHEQMKNKLENYDPLLSERTNMRNNGWLRIYDCGKIRYVV